MTAACCPDNSCAVDDLVLRDISIDPRRRAPLYYQIAQQIEAALRAGRIHPGQKLLSETLLADQVQVSVPTVHRAYMYLRDRGVLVQTHGIGTHIRDDLVQR